MTRVKTTFIVPVWENKTAPCAGANGCPAGTHIAGALYAASKGWFNMAWQIMMETHPFRSVLGRICYGFCEEPCNRGHYDSPIAIQQLEMLIGDKGFDPNWRPSMKRRNNKVVAIIGSGPAGLTAAYFLLRAGYSVEVYEADEKPGGMMRYGIPEYRLDRKVLDREIDFVISLGIKLHLKTGVDKKRFAKILADKKVAAVLVAVGTGKPKKIGMKGKTTIGLDFLRSTQHDRKPSLKGKSIVIIGGGNTAMDTSRTVVRLGAESVLVAYRRTKEEMPAHAKELVQAAEEGVQFKFLVSPLSFENGLLKLQKNRPGLPGQRSPEPIPGETEEIRADEIIMAIGQEPASGNIPKGKKVFYTGDVLENPPGTVIHAIADGKRVAEEIYRKLSGRKLFKEGMLEVPYDKMNITRYYQKRMRLRYGVTPVQERIKNFKDIDLPVNQTEAMLEADRCFKCGTCLGGEDSSCDWCWHGCSEGNLDKKMDPWAPDAVFFEATNDCDGCGKCWEDCPRNVVTPVEFEE